MRCFVVIVVVVDVDKRGCSLSYSSSSLVSWEITRVLYLTFSILRIRYVNVLEMNLLKEGNVKEDLREECENEVSCV